MAVTQLASTPATVRQGGEAKSKAPKPKVYFLDEYHPSAVHYCQSLFEAVLPGDPEHGSWRENAEYLFVRSSYVTAADIASCPRLKVVVRHGVGIDRIDAAACEARKIRILNTPGVNSQSVAELVLALAMSVAREIPQISVKQSRIGVAEKQACKGLTLYRKTVGIVGMGNIGERVARIFRGAFDAGVVAFDPFAPPDAWSDVPHRRADKLQDVLTACDVLTLHVPLTADTKGLISYRELSTMKPTAIVVNTARGGIIDEQGLKLSLDEGLIWGAGLDCHLEEPPTRETYEGLWRNRVVSTPHVGATTIETVEATAMAAVQRLVDFLEVEGV